MPIYEYRCEQGHTFEVMQRMSDDPVGSCQTCSAPVQRVFHPVAVHFKGSGFYTTDYGSRKRSADGKESSEDGATPSTSDDTRGPESDGTRGASKSDSESTSSKGDSKSTGSKAKSSSAASSSGD